jgi:signal peptidase II
MNTPRPSFRQSLGPAATLWLHGSLFLLVVLVDQLTKYWVRLRYSLPTGEPDYYLSTPVIGEWLQFRLVYNHGAAFGTKPQSLLPFLSPMVFFTIFTIIAMGCLAYYYYRLGAREKTARLGVLFILAGAVGNLIDRMVMHKVTDFIDAGIPGFSPRWPVFNVADSSVCVGIALMLIPPFFGRKQEEPASPDAAPSEGAPHAG